MLKKIVLISSFLLSLNARAENNTFFYGGYGEIKFHFNKKANTTDIHRLVSYLGYKFSDKILFNSEIEIEHANEVSVEFAYLDYILSKHITLRAGHLLIPFGLINHNHEPTLFPLVSRPEVERNIIPSTWHENGISFLGRINNFRYNILYIVGFDAKEFTPQSWIRNGRQKGGKDKAEDMALSINVDYDLNLNFSLGGSYYKGGASQGAESDIGKVDVTLWEAHLSYKINKLNFKALYTEGNLSDVDSLNEWRILNRSATRVAKKASGYYGYVSYDIASLLSLNKLGESLPIFIYHSKYDYREPSAKAITINGVGINYKPLPKVSFKLDYLEKTDHLAKKDKSINLGLGFVF